MPKRLGSARFQGRSGEQGGIPAIPNNAAGYHLFTFPPHTYIRLGSLQLDPETEDVTMAIVITLDKAADVKFTSDTDRVHPYLTRADPGYFSIHNPIHKTRSLVRLACT